MKDFSICPFRIKATISDFTRCTISEVVTLISNISTMILDLTLKCFKTALIRMPWATPKKLCTTPCAIKSKDCLLVPKFTRSGKNSSETVYLFSKKEQKSPHKCCNYCIGSLIKISKTYGNILQPA